jgi:predicted permease
MINDLLQEFRYAGRRFWKYRGSSISSVVVLALAIGANIGVFSVLEPLLLRKLPVQEPEELVQIGARGTLGELEVTETNAFFTYRRQPQMLAGVLAFAPQSQSELRENGESRVANVEVVSADYFSILGVRPFWGRLLMSDDENGAPVVVLSYEYWKSTFDGNPDTIGRAIELSGVLYTVVGVTPPSFFGLEVGKSPDLYIPLTRSGVGHADWVQIIGRLRPRISLAQAEAALTPVFADVVRTSSLPEIEREEFMTRLSLTNASRGLSDLRARFSMPILILMAIVLLILFIASGNVASLVLSKALARKKEFSLKQALGASRTTLIFQLLLEAALLICFGTGIGLLLGELIRSLLIAAFSPETMPVYLAAGADFKIVLFALFLFVIVIFLTSLLPAISATRMELGSELRVQAADTRTPSHYRVTNCLVVGQVALSVVVLTAASLLLHSLVKLETYDVGFDRDHVLLVSLKARSSVQLLDTAKFHDQVISRISALPGVHSTAFSSLSPMSGRESGVNVRAEGYSLQAGKTEHAFFASVSPGYFQTLAIPILHGRDFSPQDVQSPPKVTIINRTMARQFFGVDNPLGRHLKLVEGDRPALEIIGVVQDSTYNNLRESTTNFFYLPGISPAQIIEIRVSGDPYTFASSVHSLLSSLGSAFAVTSTETLRQQVDESLRSDRVIASLCGSLGILALGLTCVGLYGTLSFRVARRTTEIGVRIALGAVRIDILRLVVGEGLILTSVGIVLGSLGSAFCVPLLKRLLFGITYTDPFTLISVPFVLLITAIIACTPPARRAAKVDPMLILRYE